MAMDVEKIQKLAEMYPDVQDLLRDNYSLSVTVMAARMDAWQQKMEKRLEIFDANHTKAQALLNDRTKILEHRLNSAGIYTRNLQKRLADLEMENDTTPRQGQEETKKVDSS